MNAPIDITRLDEATVQLRQTKASHPEAPFMFLLFGSERALLLDTGATVDATDFPLRATVDALIAEWSGAHPRDGYGLIVAHTHAHYDHIAADLQFADRPHTDVVGVGVDEVIGYFDLERWPEHPAVIDLGGRAVDVIPGPGHENSAVVFFDRATGTLYTGDTVYPGRLYVEDHDVYRATIDRLIAFRDRADVHVTALRGCHIEMSTAPGVDYAMGAIDQPDELPLDLAPTILDEVRDAVAEAAYEPGTIVRDRFILYNLV